MKTCFKCGAVKSLTDFYKHRGMADGHLNKCKDCARDDSTTYRNKHLEKVREYDRKRGNRQTPEDRLRYRERYPNKYKAVTMVGNYVRDGKLAKPDTCSECGKAGKIHGHHDDYSKPLEVRWLCAACHHQWHAKHGEGLNA